MLTLIELVLMGVVSYAAVAMVRSATGRRAAKRGVELAGSGSTKVPCRISWKGGTGRKSFVYGKLLARPDGDLVFTRRGGRTVILPRSSGVHKELSWRTGLVVLRYAVPERGEVRILLSEADADLAAGCLRCE